jgi:hypothetical protein
VATPAPGGELWVHEIKHDGYRLLVKKHGDAVRIYTRRGLPSHGLSWWSSQTQPVLPQRMQEARAMSPLSLRLIFLWVRKRPLVVQHHTQISLVDPGAASLAGIKMIRSRPERRRVRWMGISAIDKH